MCMCADMLSMAIVWKHVRTTIGLLLTAAYVNCCRRVDLLWPKSDSAQIYLYTNTLIGPQCQSYLFVVSGHTCQKSQVLNLPKPFLVYLHSQQFRKEIAFKQH